MSIFQGILLGLLQGVAEFLPISSSGHLAVVQNLFGLEDVPLLFDVFLHLATLLAAYVLFFRKKIWELLCTFGRLFTKKNENASEQEQIRETEDRRYILAIVLTTLVTGVLGIATSKILPDFPIKAVCAGFIVTAALLVVSALLEKRAAANNTESSETAAPSWKQALVIGRAQGCG